MTSRNLGPAGLKPCLAVTGGAFAAATIIAAASSQTLTLTLIPDEDATRGIASTCAALPTSAGYAVRKFESADITGAATLQAKLTDVGQWNGSVEILDIPVHAEGENG